jgi:hypothetical protein
LAGAIGLGVITRSDKGDTFAPAIVLKGSMTKKTKRELIAYAKSIRYQRLEGFFDEADQITVNMEAKVADAYDKHVEWLAEAAGVSLEDAAAAFFNYTLLKHAKKVLPVLLEHMGGGGI